MRKLRTVVPVLVVVVLTVALFLTTSCGPQGANLTYKFTQGNTTNYASTMDLTMKITTKDVPAKIAERIPNQDMKMNVVMDTQQKVESVTGDTAKLAVTHTPKTMTMNMGGKETQAPEDAKKPTTAVMEVKPNGDIVSYTQENKNGAPGQQEGDQAKLLLMTRLPAQTVKPGFTWTEDIDQKLPMGGPGQMTMKGTVNYKFEKMETVDGKNLALITFDGDLNPKVEEGSAATMNVKGTGKLTGKAYFDPAAGNIHSSNKNLKLNMEMDLPIPGAQGAATPKLLMDANIDMKMEKAK